MNAGCLPITRLVGAVREQMDGQGYVFTEDNDIEHVVDYVLNNNKHNIKKLQQHGWVDDYRTAASLYPVSL